MVQLEALMVCMSSLAPSMCAVPRRATSSRQVSSRVKLIYRLFTGWLACCVTDTMIVLFYFFPTVCFSHPVLPFGHWIDPLIFPPLSLLNHHCVYPQIDILDLTPRVTTHQQFPLTSLLNRSACTRRSTSWTSPLA